MAAVARLMGIDLRDYEKGGEKKTFCVLHLIHVEGSVKSVKGCKCENTPCPRDLDPHFLVLGGLYQLDYEIYEFKGEQRARLSDLFLIDESVVQDQDQKQDQKAAGK